MSEPATKQDLDDLRQFLAERLEQMETRLLTEFHKWASPMDARVRSHTAAIRALDLEMEQVRDKLEGKQPE